MSTATPTSDIGYLGPDRIESQIIKIPQICQNSMRDFLRTISLGYEFEYGDQWDESAVTLHPTFSQDFIGLWRPITLRRFWDGLDLDDYCATVYANSEKFMTEAQICSIYPIYAPYSLRHFMNKQQQYTRSLQYMLSHSRKYHGRHRVRNSVVNNVMQLCLGRQPLVTYIR